VNKRREVSTGIRISAIGKSEFSGRVHGTAAVTKSRWDLDRPFVWMHVAAIESYREKLDRRLHRRIGDRNFEVTKSLDIRSVDFAICEIAM
jgi:hypothetical protein